jgi:hypothetical protein
MDDLIVFQGKKNINNDVEYEQIDFNLNFFQPAIDPKRSGSGSQRGRQLLISVN